VNRRRDTYPTVTVRKTAAKYRHLDSYMTDTDLNSIPALTDRQRKRLLRAVAFRRNVDNRGIAYAKRHQYRETSPAETLEVIGADLGVKYPGFSPVDIVAHRKVNATKATVNDMAEPSLNRSDARTAEPRPCAPTSRKTIKNLVACGELPISALDNHLGNVAKQGRTVDYPDKTVWDSIRKPGGETDKTVRT